MSKCPHCPVQDGPCIAEKPGWSFACAKAESGTAADRAFIVNRSAIDAGTFVFKPPPPTRDGPSPQASISLAESLNATRVGFNQCWFSTRADACGCSGVQCHLKGRVVGLADCVACLGPIVQSETPAHVDSL
jgi:hypothetical protein